MVNKSSKLLSLLVKILFCVNFLSSFSVVCPIEKIFKFSKELNFAKLRTPLGLKKLQPHIFHEFLVENFSIVKHYFFVRNILKGNAFI